MQQVIEGISALKKIVEGLGGKRLFLVAGSSLDMLPIKGSIETLPVQTVRFSGFTPNPEQNQVDDALGLFRDSCCDAILAVGGGSAMDLAKCLKMAVLEERNIPLIAVPTTAGSGSESTQNAVVYCCGVKQSVSHPSLLPNYAILEPSALKTLPLYQKKCAMMDALCQGIESWWSKGSTAESISYSKECIRLIVSNWREYIFGPDGGGKAAAAVMLGANFSGKAINIAKTTAPHAMSYKLTKMYGIPHGHAVALCLPGVWEYMQKNVENCAAGISKGVFDEIAASLGAGDGPLFIRTMLAELGLHKIESAGDRDAELDTLTRAVNMERLRNSPLPLDTQAIQDIYNGILI